MIAIDFTEEDIEALDYERYHHPHPKVQRKMEALWLKHQGLPHSQITRLAGISPNTLRAYLRQYKLAALYRSITAHRKVSCWLIRPQLRYFRTNPAATIRRAQKSTNSPVFNAVKVVCVRFSKT